MLSLGFEYPIIVIPEDPLLSPRSYKVFLKNIARVKKGFGMGKGYECCCFFTFELLLFLSA